MIKRAHCGSCLMALPVPPVEGVKVVRCVRSNAFTRLKNPSDCCVNFIALGRGFIYPKGSRHDRGPRSVIPESVSLVFDPKRGLIRG